MTKKYRRKLSVAETLDQRDPDRHEDSVLRHIKGIAAISLLFYAVSQVTFPIILDAEPTLAADALVTLAGAAVGYWLSGQK